MATTCKKKRGQEETLSKKKLIIFDGVSYLADVALGMEDDDVKFGRIEARQRNGGAEADGDAHAGDP